MIMKLLFFEIDYYKRIGKSSISPFQDTIVFFYAGNPIGALF